MIVNFNPSVSKKMNTPKLAKNNNPNVAFQRNFNSKEIDGLQQGKANILNDVGVFIRTGVIKAQDGALEVLKEIMQKNPNKPYLERVLAKFP